MEILTGILVSVTGIYAFLTYRILKANRDVLQEMRTEREEANRPYMLISLVVYPDNVNFYLKIKNTGRTAARNLRLTLDKDFYQFREKEEENNLRNHSAFSKTIALFVPYAEILFHLAQGFVISGKDPNDTLTPSIFTVTAEYEYGEKRVEENTTIDLRPYSTSAIPPNSIVSKLKDIKESIDKRQPPK